MGFFYGMRIFSGGLGGMGVSMDPSVTRFSSLLSVIKVDVAWFSISRYNSRSLLYIYLQQDSMHLLQS